MKTYNIYALICEILNWVWFGFSLIGVIGNSLLLIAYCGKNLRKLPVSVYYRWICLINILVLFNMGADVILSEHNLNSPVRCKIWALLLYSLGPTSIWTEVVVSLDRLVNIIYPKRFRIFSQRVFQIPTILIILAANLSLYSYVIFSTIVIYSDNFADNSTNLTNICLAGDKVTSWIDFGNVTIQFSVMLVISLILITSVWKSRRRLRDHMPEKRHHTNSIRDLKFAVTTLSLNFVFLLTNAPNIVTMVVIENSDSIDPLSSYNSKDVLSAATLIFYNAYFAFYFMIQILANNIVKKEFFNLVICGKSSDEGSKYNGP